MLTVLQLLNARPVAVPRGIGRVHVTMGESDPPRSKKVAVTDDMILAVITAHQSAKGAEISAIEVADAIDRSDDVTGDRLRRLLQQARIYRVGLAGQYRYGVLPAKGAR